TFSYLTRADSTMSVAVRTGDRWGIRGERHVSNQQTAKYIQEVRAPEQHSIDSYFTFVRWRVTCNGEDFNSREELSAAHWEAGGVPPVGGRLMRLPSRRLAVLGAGVASVTGLAVVVLATGLWPPGRVVYSGDGGPLSGATSRTRDVIAVTIGQARSWAGLTV